MKINISLNSRLKKTLDKQEKTNIKKKIFFF